MGGQMKAAELKWGSWEKVGFEIVNTHRKLDFCLMFSTCCESRLTCSRNGAEWETSLDFFIFPSTWEWVGCWQNIQLGMNCSFKLLAAARCCFSLFFFFCLLPLRHERSQVNTCHSHKRMLAAYETINRPVRSLATSRVRFSSATFFKSSDRWRTH